MREITLKRSKERAWFAFSKYIRKRDPWCVTHLIMGKKVPSENAGHFWHNVLDFDEENISGQCINCNKWNSGRLAEYSIYLLKKLGKKRYDALEKRHWEALKGEKRSIEDYLSIEKKYKTLI